MKSIGLARHAAGYNSDVPASTLTEPHLIQTPSQLTEAVTTMARQPRLAVDTESNSLYAYRERVCLMQVSVPGTDYLIDPLALDDLSPLWPLLQDSAIEKVFHAAEYDLLCLQRAYGVRVANLFDTRVASRTLGHKQAGLGELLGLEFGIRLDKRLQRANWGQRPLPAPLLDYARLDTHYLLPLRERLAADLKRAGRWEEAAEEFERLTRLEARPNGFDPSGFWKIANARQLSSEQAATLQQLYLVREEHARRSDRPPFKVLGDKTLLAIAQALPDHLDELRGLPGMTPGQLRRYGAEILEAVRRGRQGGWPRPPHTERIDEAVLARHEALRAWRKRTAAARKVESDVILPRDMLWEIAVAAPRTPLELEAVMEPLRWRARNYGADILRALWG
ncbi:MAG: HRDC domain-containing protein [Chloroflexota bacterium]